MCWPPIWIVSQRALVQLYYKSEWKCECVIYIEINVNDESEKRREFVKSNVELRGRELWGHTWTDAAAINIMCKSHTWCHCDWSFFEMDSCFPPLAALRLRDTNESLARNRLSSGQNAEKIEIFQDLDLYYIRQIAHNLKVQKGVQKKKIILKFRFVREQKLN